MLVHTVIRRRQLYNGHGHCILVYATSTTLCCIKCYGLQCSFLHVSGPYNTFLFIEILLPPRRQETSNENLTQFEAEMRENLSRLIPGCLPMVVSAQTGRVIFKPGLFLSPYSKLFISRFESQRDVDEVMRSGESYTYISVQF